MQRQNRSEFAAGCGLPLVGPELLIQEPESQRAALNSRPKLKPQTPPALAYCGHKMVLTKGSTLQIMENRFFKVMPITESNRKPKEKGV